jgi:hypothetical protein
MTNKVGNSGFVVGRRSPGRAACDNFGDANQTDDDLQAGQGLTAPVLADERKQPVFNLVPLAGSWRGMAHSDPQLGFLSEFL